MLRGVWQALNCLSIHATYCVIVAGPSPGETKMWAGVHENGDFFTFVDHVKTNKHMLEFFSPSGSHTILVYRSYTDTKHRAASSRQQSFLLNTIVASAAWCMKYKKLCCRKEAARCFVSVSSWLRCVNSTQAQFLSRVSILTRDIDIANLSVCLSVRLPVTFRYQMKTA